MMKNILNLILLLILPVPFLTAQEWKPVEGNMMTRWASQVSPENVHQEYPRPQLVRKEWKNLNGLWNYAVTPIDSEQPAGINDGKILVPFAIESALSGVKKHFSPQDKLWYETSFTIPSGWSGKHIILHFGAVDYECIVWVNGIEVGTHRGSSDSFKFDITNALVKNGTQKLVLSVIDPTDKGKQPRGKQMINPEGIWYTPVSGIWKTVWLEPVERSHIYSIRSIPDIDASCLTFSGVVTNPKKTHKIKITAYDNGTQIATATGKPMEDIILPIRQQKLWSPSNPFLYDMKVELLDGNKVVDQLDSYFGMRKSSIAQDENGVIRMMLNNEFLFQFGFLDQGWWPDGLLTPPSDEALLYDIEFTKKAGYNTIRKHIKQESDQFYYHCDKLGILVWQDAVSGDDFIWRSEVGFEKTAQAATDFFNEYKNMVDQLYNFPCIVKWIVFNEGWGQYGKTELLDWTKYYDPTRLASISGWIDDGYGDICDIHRYPGPGRLDNTGGHRAIVLGEFGGVRTVVRKHLWSDNIGRANYKNTENLDEYRAEYKRIMYQLRILIEQGLSGAIYTQTTDVENEVNGMLTYNREMSKLSVDELKEYHSKLYTTPVIVSEVMPNSERKVQVWKYTFNRPEKGWEHPDYKPVMWKTGNGFFGWNNPKSQYNYSFFERLDFAHHPKTIWNTPDIWMRREFVLDEIPDNPILNIWFDDKAEIYINGTLVAAVEGRTAPNTHYEYHRFLSGTEKALKVGVNTIAVHCYNNMRGPGNQAIDVAIMNVEFE